MLPAIASMTDKLAGGFIKIEVFLMMTEGTVFK
jgi:hypothetical protein